MIDFPYTQFVSLTSFLEYVLLRGINGFLKFLNLYQASFSTLHLTFEVLCISLIGGALTHVNKLSLHYRLGYIIFVLVSIVKLEQSLKYVKCQFFNCQRQINKIKFVWFDSGLGNKTVIKNRSRSHWHCPYFYTRLQFGRMIWERK